MPRAEVEYAFADCYIHIAGGVPSDDQHSSSHSGSSAEGLTDAVEHLGRRLAAVRRPAPPPPIRRAASAPSLRPPPPTPVRRAAVSPSPPPPRPPPPAPVPTFVPNDPWLKEQWALVSVPAAAWGTASWIARCAGWLDCKVCRLLFGDDQAPSWPAQQAEWAAAGQRRLALQCGWVRAVSAPPSAAALPVACHAAEQQLSNKSAQRASQHVHTHTALLPSPHPLVAMFFLPAECAAGPPSLGPGQA